MAYKNRHAYLICAHNNYKTLALLLETLDSSNVDIYIHIDRKSEFTLKDKEDITANVKESKIYFSKRINVWWGGYSQTKAFVNLIRQAVETGKYDYFHMLTGQTMPIKSKALIEEFYEKNYGKEFIHFSTTDSYDRVRYYLPFSENFSNLKGIKRFINRAFISLQKRIKIDLFKHHNLEYRWGSAFGSITEGFAKYLISQENKIKKCFSHTPISCESYLQTVLWNSQFRDNIFEFGEKENHLLYVKWEGGYGHADVINKEEFQTIASVSKALWACKFDDKTSCECFRK